MALLVLWSTTAAISQAPNWLVDPANFAHNMSLTAQVVLDGNGVNGPANLLGAFVGNEVRGVAQPTMIGGQAYYFMTVFSNAAAGETLTFKTWIAPTNTVYEALEQPVFLKNSTLGNYPDGYVLHFVTGNDWPPSLLPIPADTALAAFPFGPIDLDEYLVSVDNDPVVYTFVPGAGLSVSFSGPGNVLTVAPVDPSWTGTDSVLVTATETGTAAGFSASRHVSFTVLPDYAGPVFGEFPLQFIQPYLPLPGGDLGDQLTFGGTCLEYAVRLAPHVGNVQPPGWVQPAGNSGAMTLVARARFGGHDFPLNAENKLAAFVGGQLAGVAVPQPWPAGQLFYLTVANVGTGLIALRFYDAANQYLYEHATGIPFVASGSAGTWSNPVALELAPVSVLVTAAGTWSVAVLDTTWTGGQRGWFFATDCDVPAKRDSAEVVFLVGRCPEQILELPTGGGLCIEAEGDAHQVVWYMDGEQVGAGSTFSATLEGMYHYEGWDVDSCHLVRSCPLFVVSGNGPENGQPPIKGDLGKAYAAALPFFQPPPACGGVVVDTISVSPNPTAWYRDADSDGHSNGQTTQVCESPGAGWYLPSQLVALSGDCNDSDPAIHPGTPELCNGVDDDCSGSPEAATNTWTATSPGNWSDSANWSDGIVPLACQHVVVPAGAVVTVPGGVTAVGKTLEVALNVVLTVTLTGVLDVKF